MNYAHLSAMKAFYLHNEKTYGSNSLNVYTDLICCLQLSQNCIFNNGHKIINSIQTMDLGLL